MRRRKAILYVHKLLLPKTPGEIERLQQRAAALDWSLIRTLVDESNAPYPLSRGAVKQLFSAIEAREANAVLIPAMRHLGGGPSSVLGCLAAIVGAGGAVVSLTRSDDLDTTRKDSPPFVEMWHWHQQAERVLLTDARRKGIRRAAVAGRHGGPGGGAMAYPDTNYVGEQVFTHGVPKSTLARRMGETEHYVRVRCDDYLRLQPADKFDGRAREILKTAAAR